MPIFEELLFRVILQGTLLRIAYQATIVQVRASRTGRSDGNDSIGSEGSISRTGSTAEQVAPTVRRGIRLLTALLFAALHTMNHAEALMSVDAVSPRPTNVQLARTRQHIHLHALASTC